MKQCPVTGAIHKNEPESIECSASMKERMFGSCLVIGKDVTPEGEIIEERKTINAKIELESGERVDCLSVEEDAGDWVYVKTERGTFHTTKQDLHFY